MRWSAHISWLFAELPYAERVGAARRAGFTTIETAWPESREDREALITAVAREHVEVALLNCPAGDVGAGERGFVNDDSRREEAERALANAIELAAAIGAHNLNLLVGRALPDVPEMRQRAAVVSALRTFAPIAGAAGLRILLEPLNSIENPGFLAATPDDAIALIEAAADDRVGLLLDVYHVARMGQDPVDAIERHAERIAHVQLSDCPGRGSPGTGKLDFAAIFARLDASGYDGAVGLEYDAGGAEAGLAAIAGLGDGYLPQLIPAM
jgi:hydroxypyruvate isomerase